MVADNLKMILQLPEKQCRNILLDIDTQCDFLLAEGKACVWNHSEVLANIRRIMAWARHRNIPVISTAEVRSDNDGVGTRYCIDGTNGQKKLRYTLLRSRVSFAADDKNTLPADLLQAHRQVVLHKRCIDPFDEPRIERLLSEIHAGQFILIGAGAEDAVKATALGLLHRGRKVSVVVDALGSHNRKEAKLALRIMKAKGAKLLATKNLAGISHLRYVFACKCQSCHGTTATVSCGEGTDPANADFKMGGRGLEALTSYLSSRHLGIVTRRQ
jgi:nicotinamidase-related amidase